MQFERGNRSCSCVLITPDRAEELALLRSVQRGVIAPNDQLLADETDWVGVASHLEVFFQCVRAALLAHTPQFGP